MTRGASSTAAVILLACTIGCGGGGGGSSRVMATGQAILGPLCNADVNLYHQSDLHNPIYSTTTSDSTNLGSAGIFSIPQALLQDTQHYVVTISGGTDIDADDDGVLDNKSTVNSGTLHVMATGGQMKVGAFKANILTDIVYHKVSYLVLAGYPNATILSEMQQHARSLLKEDVNGDGLIDYDDLLTWDPVADKDKAGKSQSLLRDCCNSIHAGTGYADTLAMLDKSTVGSLDTPGQANRLTVAGDYAYVADGSYGLQVIDVSDPFAPQIVGSAGTPGQAEDVVLIGFVALVADGDAGVQVINVSDPQNPDPIAALTIDTPGRAVGLAYADGFVYVADGDAGLQIIDFRGPGNPYICGSVDTPGSAKGVSLEGGYAFVADTFGGLLMIDVRNPLHPVLARTLTSTDSYDVVVSDGRVFSTHGLYGLSVFDVSDPQNPSQICSYDTIGQQTSLFARGSQLYIAGPDGGLQVVDVSHMRNPTLSGSVNIPGDVTDITLAGSHAFLTRRYQGLSILDVSDPTQLVNRAVVGQVKMPSFTTDVAVKDGFAYVMDNRATYIVDVADPQNPTLVATSPVTGISIEITGDVAYTTYDSVTAIDITNPLAPISVGNSQQLGDWAMELALSGGYAFVANSSAGLRVLDVSSPPDFPVVQTLTGLGWPRGVTVAGSYAYVAASGDGLHVVDIADPANPVLAHTVDTPARATAVTQGYAYVVGYNGLQVLDITDPPGAVIVGAVDTPGGHLGVAVSGNYAYVAAGTAGLQLIDIRDPTAPFLAGAFESYDSVQRVAVSGDHIYIADYTGGLIIFKAVKDR